MFKMYGKNFRISYLGNIQENGPGSNVFFTLKTLSVFSFIDNVGSRKNALSGVGKIIREF